MKFLISTLLLSSSTLAFAADYTCVAKANPNRGFDQEFTIEVMPAEVGGTVRLTSKDKMLNLGTVAELGTLEKYMPPRMKTKPEENPAFGATLGLIGEEDVSGIPANRIGDVDALKIIKVKTGQGVDDDEIFVYQLMSKGNQIGGTFMASGLATNCAKK